MAGGGKPGRGREGRPIGAGVTWATTRRTKVATTIATMDCNVMPSGQGMSKAKRTREADTPTAGDSVSDTSGD